MSAPDWRHRGEYIRSRRRRKGSESETDIEPLWANEAYQDPTAVIVSPDPASRSGDTDRVIGWSDSAGFLITVIVLRSEDGHLWGVNAWKSNQRDAMIYERTEER